MKKKVPYTVNVKFATNIMILMVFGFKEKMRKILTISNPSKLEKNASVKAIKYEERE
jgi:hypothetical protein